MTARATVYIVTNDDDITPVFRWIANRHKQHLFDAPYTHTLSACGTAYAGDNPNPNSRAKRCRLCERVGKRYAVPL